MIVFPNAKINIGLRIRNRRPDNYHEIETILYPVRLCDALEFVVSDDKILKDSLEVTGINIGIPADDNLVIKTLLKIRRSYSFPFLKIHLHKVIPAGAGLGGGSSDAACLLKVINKHFELNIDSPDLKALALELGSDCPFFIDGMPSLATGRGEILTSIRSMLSGYYLVIVNPGTGINTAEAYKNCQPGIPSESLMELAEASVKEWKGLIINDFEDFAFNKYPEICDMKEELYKTGALFSLMSGSGSSVYGIFQKKPELDQKLEKFVIWEGIL
jgi:4-diphosphocytidyl-2-C-methyl-D-erythritol kinase